MTTKQKTNEPESIPFRKWPLAVTDIETTGLIRQEHEIIEIGLVVTDQTTLEILDTFEAKIIPEHIETASPRSLEINGYTPDAWRDAIPLAEALERYNAKTKDTIFVAQNPTFDWGFLDHAFYKAGLTSTMDYHRIDIFSLAYKTLYNTDIPSFRLNAVAQFLGLKPEPEPHRALTGAMHAYEVFKKLLHYKK